MADMTSLQESCLIILKKKNIFQTPYEEMKGFLSYL